MLIRPIGGRWNPRVDFEETVLAHHPSITPEQFAAAIAAGDSFFAASSSTPDYDDYHRVMLRHVGLDPTPQFLADLGRDVPATTILELYPDVMETLRELKPSGRADGGGLGRLGGTARWAHGAGDRGVLRGVCDLPVLGCRKPDPRMYHHASAALDLAPAQCLFVDDDPSLVDAAIALGCAGRAVCRDSATSDVPSVVTLVELLDLL